MLIIYSHPNKKGHCGYVLEMLNNAFEKKNINVELLDLYDMDFDPILHDEEHYTSGGRKITAIVRAIQKKISLHNTLIFVYPVWWNSPPAILKGFFDKVFSNHYAFEYRNKIPIGLLKGKRAFVIATTGGPMIYERTLAGNRALNVVVRDILRFCGIKTKGFLIDRALELNARQKQKIQKKVKKIVGMCV